jgi:thiosulfate dehydrogenase [quinone] large subunit
MTRTQTFLVILLRIAVGWFLLYQGIVAIFNPGWSILPLVQPAHTFPQFYAAVTQANVLMYVTYLIKGLFIIAGLSLILGILVRIGALLGILVTLFFYFPTLAFPYSGTGYYIIDPHLLVAIVLAYLFVVKAGEFFGLGKLLHFSRY